MPVDAESTLPFRGDEPWAKGSRPSFPAGPGLRWLLAEKARGLCLGLWHYECRDPRCRLTFACAITAGSGKVTCKRCHGPVDRTYVAVERT